MHGASTRWPRPLLPVLLSPFLGACATSGATWNSGVGDAFLSEPPYYAATGVTALAGDASAVGHLPIAYQRGATNAPVFDPEPGPGLQSLLAEMNAYLDSLGLTVRVAEGGLASAVTHAATRQPPDVRFGCVADPVEPDECVMDGDEALGRKDHRMHLAVGRPSGAWIAWTQQLMVDTGVDAVLVLTLEVGHYLVRQRGFVGRKELELGTAHVVSLPWLTSLETPVSVLQLTGALVGSDGKARRIGAEGLLARRTSMKVVALGGQELVTEEDVDALRRARREDLPGAPSTWKVGLRTLVEQLLPATGGSS